MKLLHKSFVKNGEGQIKLVTEERTKRAYSCMTIIFVSRNCLDGRRGLPAQQQRCLRCSLGSMEIEQRHMSRSQLFSVAF